MKIQDRRLLPVSGSTTQVPHTTVESITFHESNPLTTFCNVTSRRPGHYFEPFSSAAPHFETRFPLARLVEAEIVSPYCGILINTGMGNLTVPSARPLGNRRVLRRVGRRLIFISFIKR